jgi:hypothetical protein
MYNVSKPVDTNCNFRGRCSLINELWEPSSNRMFAGMEVLFEMTMETAVFNNT